MEERRIIGYTDLLDAQEWVQDHGGHMVVSQASGGPVEAALLTYDGDVEVITSPYNVTIVQRPDGFTVRR